MNPINNGQKLNGAQNGIAPEAKEVNNLKQCLNTLFTEAVFDLPEDLVTSLQELRSLSTAEVIPLDLHSFFDELIESSPIVHEKAAYRPSEGFLPEHRHSEILEIGNNPEGYIIPENENVQNVVISEDSEMSSAASENDGIGVEASTEAVDYLIESVQTPPSPKFADVSTYKIVETDSSERIESASSPIAPTITSLPAELPVAVSKPVAEVRAKSKKSTQVNMKRELDSPPKTDLNPYSQRKSAVNANKLISKIAKNSTNRSLSVHKVEKK